VKPAVFLDRDGTIVANRHYLADPDGLELLPGSAAALRTLAAAGYCLVIVTNQSGVGRGYFSVDDLERQHSRLRDLLAAEDVQLAGIYSCTHGPDDGCECRKPLPGMLLQAAGELDLDLGGSFAIGDEVRDAEAGLAAGATPILLGRDAHDLLEAAQIVASSLAP
jgi:D-glycero-D-manno-heptose 1,7-bisphosphate phosphatase